MKGPLIFAPAVILIALTVGCQDRQANPVFSQPQRELREITVTNEACNMESC